jgi:RES domain-containing protein
VSVEGTWWRIGRPGGNPLALTPEPADGRWQRGDVVRGLYLADGEATAWAEWYRHSAELAVPPQARLPRAIYRFDVSVDDVADLTRPGVLAAHGVASLVPSRRQWRRTQPIGEAYFAAGRRAVLVPSAAHDGGRVLVVFRAPGSNDVPGVAVVGRGRRVTELPALPTGLRT